MYPAYEDENLLIMGLVRVKAVMHLRGRHENVEEEPTVNQNNERHNFLIFSCEVEGSHLTPEGIDLHPVVANAGFMCGRVC